MHDNRRYVKLALICLAGLLPLASTQGARAEIVTSQTDQGVLAIAADGTPYVAYTIGRQLYVATRAHPDRWQARRLGGLPGGRVLLAGIAVSERPRRSVSVLAEDEQGAWVVLARGNRIETLARAGAKSSFGPAGLTLDRRQRPAVAYAVHRESGRTSLRLITFDAAGRRQARTITREGFPSSVFPPGAAPVLVRGRLHVVETFTEAAMSGAIDWGPKAGGDWEGQFLFASVGSSPLGLVGAVFLSSTLWSAWTLVSPGAESQDISVSLTSSAATQETSSLTHGIFVAIANGGQEPEVGAYDWVDVSGDWRAYAAIVIAGRGGGEVAARRAPRRVRHRPGRVAPGAPLARERARVVPCTGAGSSRDRDHDGACRRRRHGHRDCGRGNVGNGRHLPRDPPRPTRARRDQPSRSGRLLSRVRSCV